MQAFDRRPTVSAADDHPATLTDDDIETRRAGRITAHAGDDTGDVSDSSDTGDDSGDVSDTTDTGDDSGDVSDTSDTGDDSGSS
jgi:hypothetical protein